MEEIISVELSRCEVCAQHTLPKFQRSFLIHNFCPPSAKIMRIAYSVSPSIQIPCDIIFDSHILKTDHILIKTLISAMPKLDA